MTWAEAFVVVGVFVCFAWVCVAALNMLAAVFA